MKFVILHHGACPIGRLHYIIRMDGAVQSLLAEDQAGSHANSIGIAVEGDLDVHGPEPEQMAALRALLVELKLRYPDIRLGGHRQVRGNETTCPGRCFPLTELRRWADGEWERARDAAIAASVESQCR